MKKFIYSLFVVMMATTSLFITGCNDNEEDLRADIIGTWKPVSVEGDYATQFIQFRTDGTCFVVAYVGEIPDDYVPSFFQWSISGKTLKIGSDFFKIEKLNSTELVYRLKDGGLSSHFVKVPDGEMAKYL